MMCQHRECLTLYLISYADSKISNLSGSKICIFNLGIPISKMNYGRESLGEKKTTPIFRYIIPKCASSPIISTKDNYGIWNNYLDMF
jgi:hypothetical protein